MAVCFWAIGDKLEIDIRIKLAECLELGSVHGAGVEFGFKGIFFVDDKIHLVLVLGAPEVERLDRVLCIKEVKNDVLKVAIAVPAVGHIVEVVQNCVADAEIAEIELRHFVELFGVVAEIWLYDTDFHVVAKDVHIALDRRGRNIEGLGKL